MKSRKKKPAAQPAPKSSPLTLVGRQHARAPSAFLIGGKKLVDGNCQPISAPPKYDMAAAARRVYESFIREAGYKDDARVPLWEKLKTFQQARWRTIAQDVIDAATGKTRNTA